MADKISALPRLSPIAVNDADVIPTVNAGATSGMSIATLRVALAAMQYGPFALFADEAGATGTFDLAYPRGDVRRYGVVMGLATNQSTAFQAAINDLHGAGGGKLIIPNGTLTLGDINLYSNIEWVGSGWGTKISKAAGATYLVSVNAGSGGTPDPANNQRNISIKNTWFEGLSASGFSEFHHLLNLNAVSDVLIESCKLTSFEGDAVMLGSSNVGATERHNERITIRKCVFDGVNKENRNAISVIDCDTLTVDDNYFTRCSRPTMPGPIDVEPDNNFAILRKLRFTNNRFEDNGGNVAAIGIVLALPNQNNGVNPAWYTSPVRDVVIADNFINTPAGAGITYIQRDTVMADTSVPTDLVIERNVVLSSARPFTLDGVKNAKVVSNTFRDSTTQPLLALLYPCQDVIFEKNLFERCAVDNNGFGVYNVKRLVVDNNDFVDCGTAGAGIGISFQVATSSYVTVTNNRFRSPAGRMPTGISLGGHTFTSDTNVSRDNVGLNGITAFDIPSTGAGATFCAAYSGDSTTLPDTFPVGVYYTLVNGDTGVPNVGGQQGIIVTEKVLLTAAYRKFVRQLFHPANNSATALAMSYQRTGLAASNAWSPWTPVTPSGLQSVTYVAGGTSAIDLNLGSAARLIVTSNTAGSVIGFPTNIAAGVPFSVHLVNSSGGALTNIVFHASYHLASAISRPANGTRRVYQFSTDDGTFFYEVSRSSADIA